MEKGDTAFEFNPSQNLAEARRKVLELPGMQAYVPDRKKSYAEIEEGIEKAISDLNQQLDAEGSVIFIKNALGFTDEESEDFFSHPERQPFKSRLQLSEAKDVFKSQLQVIGAYLGLRYEQAGKRQDIDSEELKKTAENLNFYYESSLLYLFTDESNSIEDEINGVTERQKGARISHEMQELFSQASAKVAQERGVNTDDLHSEVLAVTQEGNFVAASNFLTDYQGSSNVREVLQNVVEERRHNRDLAREKLKLLWRVETYRLSMGLNLDTIYSINNLPNGKTIEKIMHEFLRDKDNVSEMLNHLKKETPNTLSQTGESKGPVDFWQMLAERARYHHFAQRVESTDELKAKKEKMWKEISKYLPSLAFDDVPTSYIDTPTRLGAQTRAYNVTYTNTESGLVNVSLVNPRDELSWFTVKTGHEMGHKIHARVLKVAENAGYVQKQSWDKLDSSVREEFSQELEDQIAKIQKSKSEEDHKKAKKEGKWRDLWNAYLIRKQAAYTLVQRDVRVVMEELWNEGKRDELTDSEADMIIDELQPKLRRYYSEGVDIASPTQTVTNNVNVTAPLDGLVYLLRYIKESEAKSNRPVEAYVGIKEAFSSRFGDIWIDNPEARAILLSLMGESGRNQNVEAYANFIATTPVDEAIERLKSWGIESEQI